MTTSHFPKVWTLYSHTHHQLRQSLRSDIMKIYAPSHYESEAVIQQEAHTLPAATVQKIINEVLATNPTLNDGSGNNMTFAKDTRDVLIECCVEFITMLTSEANEIAEKDAKKTIACEHITKALEELGFGEYVPELLRVADEFKSAAAVSPEGFIHIAWWWLLTGQQHRERKQTKIEQSGMGHEELLRMQEELFKNAGEKYNAAAE